MSALSGYEGDNLSLEQVDFLKGIPEQADRIERGFDGVSSWEADYEKLHIKFPFLQINPPVGAVNTGIFLSAGSLVEIRVPYGAKLVRFTSIGNIYVAHTGANMSILDSNINDGTASCLNPLGWYYCGGKSSYSVFGTTANGRVFAEFYIQL